MHARPIAMASGRHRADGLAATHGGPCVEIGRDRFEADEHTVAHVQGQHRTVDHRPGEVDAAVRRRHHHRSGRGAQVDAPMTGSVGRRRRCVRLRQPRWGHRPVPARSVGRRGGTRPRTRRQRRSAAVGDVPHHEHRHADSHRESRRAPPRDTPGPTRTSCTRHTHSGSPPPPPSRSRTPAGGPRGNSVENPSLHSPVQRRRDSSRSPRPKHGVPYSSPVARRGTTR
jgi:hypothetical protein